MAQVRLILKDEVYGLGEAGDLVSVKPGYARNFLLPQGKAEVATESRVKEFEHKKAVIAEKAAKEMKDVEAARDRIEKIHLEFEAQAGEQGRLFGSITAANIAEQLAEKGVDIDRRKIELKEPIKTLGEHSVVVKIRREVHATVNLTVNASAAPPPEIEVEEPEPAHDFEAEDDADERDEKPKASAEGDDAEAEGDGEES